MKKSEIKIEKTELQIEKSEIKIKKKAWIFPHNDIQVYPKCQLFIVDSLLSTLIIDPLLSTLIA